MSIRIGSLCSGYGGLDSALQQVIGGDLAWVADNNPGAAAVLAHHYPDAPNLGDITTVDWATVEPVDIVCAGFPCTDLSYAGHGAGIVKGNRSGLWYTIADAIGVLRPGLVVLENVAAIVGRRPGLDVVLADLARLGFDAVWRCIRASDVGAPHRRERWFLVAHPADVGHERGRLPRGRRPGPAHGGLSATDAQGHVPSGHDTLALDGSRQARPGPVPGDRLAVADADGRGRHRNAGHARLSPIGRAAPDGDSASGLDWGPYRAAIGRWERILGRPAPHPTERAPKGGQRLSPIFVEWLMGLPEGHVTAVPGLSRNQQLTLLGNGVVPQQAAHALRLLLETVRREVAA